MEVAKKKVLICDDSMLVRRQLKAMLEEEFGCEVSEAANGQEAVVQYQAEHPTLVFMDIVMPECDGLEALKQIRLVDPKAHVVMVSSTGTSEKLITALKLGAVDFIQKPFEQEQISKALAGIRG